MKERLRARIEQLKKNRKRDDEALPRKRKRRSNGSEPSNNRPIASVDVPSVDVPSVDVPSVDVPSVDATSTSSMLFQTFDVPLSSSTSAGSKKLRGKAHLKNLLAKAESQRQRAQELRQSDPSRAKAEKWNTLIDRASGKKVRDDPKRLKKALKRREQEKRRSQVKWRERQDALQEEMTERQERKRTNLQGKRTRGRPDTTARAGFEGHGRFDASKAASNEVDGSSTQRANKSKSNQRNSNKKAKSNRRPGFR